MAYSNLRMCQIGGSFANGTNATRLWSYFDDTTDLLATIVTSAYFNTNIKQLSVGDIIFCTGTDDDMMAKVTSVTTNVQVTEYVQAAIDPTADYTMAKLTLTDGAVFSPTTVANTSMTPINIAYNYLGATNTGTDLDNYGFRCAITQTSSNALTLGNRGYIMGMRSDIHVDGYADDAYAMYAKTYVDGTSTLNQLYGLNIVSARAANAVTMDETGNIAGVGISMNGTGDVTCGGTGFGKVSGMYINWNETNAMTVDTCGVYIGMPTSSKLDSAFRVNAVGTLVNTLHSYNAGGTITNVIKVVASHAVFADFDDSTGECCTQTGSASTTWSGRVKVVTPDGSAGYINIYSTKN